MSLENMINNRLSYLFRLDISPEPWLTRSWLALAYHQELGHDFQEMTI